MSKRILSLVLALVMVLGTFGTVFAAEPAVATVEKDAATFLKEAKVLLGDDKGDLNLDLKLERRDMVILLSRLMGEEEVASKFPVTEVSPTWEDVRSDAYYLPVLAWGQVNKFFEGKTAKAFGPREAITAQDYSLVLLRALGYEVTGHEDWKAALSVAKELGILADVVVEDATEITRGQMSVMTLNALAVNVKDSTKTLAETLEIVLPTPSVLAVEEVVADNLMEIKVELNKEADFDVEDIDLYSVKGLAVTNAFVEDDNTLVLSLKEKMTNKKTYELVIKGTAEIDGKYSFTALDNAIPTVVSVEALGTKALKVIMSEPVKGIETKNFRIDGNAYFGAKTIVGREIILTPYGNVLTVGEHKLSVSSLEDFAGFKSLETTVEFEVIEDKVAPEVASVTGTLERIVVTFSEDVDDATVTKNSLYWNTKTNTGTPVRLAGNKYAFEFAKSLPLYEVTLNIQGVKDYSGNTMKAVEMSFKGELDDVRPEVVEAAVKADTNATVITVKFSKPVDKDEAAKTKYYTLTDKDGKVVRIKSAKLVNSKTAEVEVYNSLKKEETYTFKVEGIKDTTKLSNTMFPYEGKLTVSGAAVDTKVTGAAGNNTDRTIHVLFSKAMDMGTIANLDNYMIKNGSVVRLLSAIDDVEIDIIDGGKAVIITLPKQIDKKDVVIGGSGVTHITVLGARDTDDNIISNHGEAILVVVADALMVKATAESETKIVVEFDQAIVDVNENAFAITGDKTVKVTDAVADGSKKVVLTVNELPADADNYVLSVIDNDNIETVLKNDVAEMSVTLTDKIAPSLVGLKGNTVVTGNEVEFVLEFDEELTTGASVGFFAQDIEVVRFTETKVLRRGIDFITTAVSGNAKQIKVTITNKEILAVASEYGINIDKTAYIRDVNGNAVNESEEEVIVKVTPAMAHPIVLELAVPAVEKAEVSKKQADVDAAKKLVNALLADVDPATTKADLLDRIADIVVE